MPNLRDVRDCLLLGFEENMLTDEELILLYDMNTSKNPDFPYWQYESFDLDDLCDDECKAEFRFMKKDICHLKDVLQVPDEVVSSGNNMPSDSLNHVPPTRPPKHKIHPYSSMHATL